MVVVAVAIAVVAVQLSIYLPIYLSICLSARLKTKQFCETSSIFEVDNIKTKQFCETSFNNGKLSAELTASYQCVLRFFHSICLKHCACHEKVCQVIRSAAPVTQNHLGKPEDPMLQNATRLRKFKSAP